MNDTSLYATFKMLVINFWSPLAILVVFMVLGGCQLGQIKGNGSRTPSALKERSISSDSKETDPYHAFRFHAPGRVVAIGDLHGDFAAAYNAMRVAGAIDSDMRWIGGDLVIVQTGDQIDRWHNDRKVLDFFTDIAAKAEALGGKVISLNGNHELWNVILGFTFVTPGSFAEFLNYPIPAGDEHPPHYESKDKKAPGALQRAYAFRPGGTYAQLLAKRPMFAIVNDTIFVHGGITPQNMVDLPQLNEETRRWMLGDITFAHLTKPARLMISEDNRTSPVGTRIYGSRHLDASTCASVKAVLQAIGVKRMVVGHTPQDEINSDCDKQVWRIDVGLSRGFSYPNSEALLIAGDNVEVLHPKKIDFRDTVGYSPFHDAVNDGVIQDVIKLIKDGADKNMQTKQGSTPLMLAVENNHFEVFKILMAEKVDVNLPGELNFTPLSAAAAYGNLKMVEALLGAGADKEKENLRGDTPVHQASASGHLEVAKTLIEAGAEADKANYQGHTPLALAVHEGKLTLVKYLLEKGANPRSKDILSFAKKQGHEMENLIVKAQDGFHH